MTSECEEEDESNKASIPCPLQRTQRDTYQVLYSSQIARGGIKKRETTEEELEYFRVKKAKIHLDGRTTLMIKNIPNKMDKEMLKSSLHEIVPGRVNFLYLPIDFKNKCNVGYGFVNLSSTQDVEVVYNNFHSAKWSYLHSPKVCEITYARVQGFRKLL